MFQKIIYLLAMLIANIINASAAELSEEMQLPIMPQVEGNVPRLLLVPFYDDFLPKLTEQELITVKDDLQSIIDCQVHEGIMDEDYCYVARALNDMAKERVRLATNPSNSKRRLLVSTRAILYEINALLKKTPIDLQLTRYYEIERFINYHNQYLRDNVPLLTRLKLYRATLEFVEQQDIEQLSPNTISIINYVQNGEAKTQKKINLSQEKQYWLAL